MGTDNKPEEKTNTIKWAWVIGGTLGIYALLYYVNKKQLNNNLFASDTFSAFTSWRWCSAIPTQF